MMGEVAAQGSLLTGDYLHLDYVGRTTFYGWLATEGPRGYPDGAFREFYVLDNGRKSVPPSQMMRMVLLQWYDKVSDDEAVQRTKFDLRWKTALGIEDHEGLCVKFTLQTFRAKLVLSERGRAILERSVKACREAGGVRSRTIRASVDTSPILGRGAVKDTYNLVADGMVKLLGALAAFETPLLEAVDGPGYAGRHDCSRYFAAVSLKGGAELDWDSESERNAFVTGLVVDVRRALALARASLESAVSFCGPRAGSAGDVRAAMQLLDPLVDQDIEVHDDGQAQIKRGVAHTLGDCAYGTAANRRAFADAGRALLAKQPALHNGGRFTQDDFIRDEDTGARTCPAGHTVAPRSRTVPWRGEKVQTRFYRWPAAICSQCPQRQRCLAPPKDNAPPRPRGRTLTEHPEHALLAQARAQQRSPGFQADYRERQTVEHRLARMMQLGCRQARYGGRAKTEFQWIMAATVANLTLVAQRQKAPNPAHSLGVTAQRFLRRILQAIQAIIPWIADTPSQWAFARLGV